MSHPLPTMAVLLTAAAAAFLTALAFLSFRRSRDPRMLWLAGAFALFLAKALVTAWDLRTDFLGHERLEMFGATMDLVILVVLIVPLFRRP